MRGSLKIFFNRSSETWGAVYQGMLYNSRMARGSDSGGATAGLGARLTTAIKESPYSQRQVAEHMGVSDQAVSNWKNDKNLPGKNRLVELALLLSVNPLWLLLGAGEPREAPPQEESATSTEGTSMDHYLLNEIMALRERVGVLEAKLAALDDDAPETRSRPRRGRRTS